MMQKTKAELVMNMYASMSILLGRIQGILNTPEKGPGTREIVHSIDRLQESMFWLRQVFEIFQKEEQKPEE